MNRILVGLMAALTLFAAVGCSGQKNTTQPQPQDTQATTAKATATTSPTPGPDKVGALIQQNMFNEAITATSGFSVQERDAALKKVLDAALQYGDFDNAYNAAWRVANLQARDAALETVFKAALARDNFSIALSAAEKLPGKHGQELISQIVNAAAERGKFYDAVSAAGKLTGPAEQKARVKELMEGAIAQGYSLEQIYFSSGFSQGIVLQLIKEKNPNWTIPPGR